MKKNSYYCPVCGSWVMNGFPAFHVEQNCKKCKARLELEVGKNEVIKAVIRPLIKGNDSNSAFQL